MSVSLFCKMSTTRRASTTRPSEIKCRELLKRRLVRIGPLYWLVTSVYLFVLLIRSILRGCGLLNLNFRM